MKGVSLLPPPPDRRFVLEQPARSRPKQAVTITQGTTRTAWPSLPDVPSQMSSRRRVAGLVPAYHLRIPAHAQAARAGVRRGQTLPLAGGHRRGGTTPPQDRRLPRGTAAGTRRIW